MSYPNYPYPGSTGQSGGGYPPPVQQPAPYPSQYPSYPPYPGGPQPPAAYGQPYAAAGYGMQPQYQQPQPYYPAPASAGFALPPPSQNPYPGNAHIPPPGGPQYHSTPGAAPYPTPFASVPTAVHGHVVQSPMEQNIPTVLPASPFDARSDADVLHKAMKGFGTDENALISVLCRRTSQQRSQINQAYKSSYGKDLQSKLKSELSGNLEKVLVALSLPMADYMAHEMHEAVCGLGTAEGTLVEILVSGTNQEIRDINAAYLRLYGHPMEKDIKGDTSGTLKMLLVSLAQGNRDENQAVDFNKARDDAQRLYQAGEAKMGTDESAFNSILASRSWPHLRQVMAEYQAMRGHSLEKAVVSEFSANAEKGMLGILQCAQSRPAYFARRLNNAVKGAGTKDRNLIRIIVSRCDVDLGNIKREYQNIFGRSLQQDVAGDTSGDYKKALLALIG